MIRGGAAKAKRKKAGSVNDKAAKATGRVAHVDETKGLPARRISTRGNRRSGILFGGGRFHRNCVPREGIADQESAGTVFQWGLWPQPRLWLVCEGQGPLSFPHQ